MVTDNHVIIAPLRTQIERTSVRLSTYARLYETFKLAPAPTDEDSRELRMSIAYLYHTSLSILEERKKSLEDYCADVTDVLQSFISLSGVEKADAIQALTLECQTEIKNLNEELQQIDEGIAAAKQHQRELLFDE